MGAPVAAKRTPLARRWTGGVARVGLDGVPDGGHFELRFGDGLSTHVELHPR